jgi:hypothetical protein
MTCAKPQIVEAVFLAGFPVVAYFGDLLCVALCSSAVSAVKVE